MGTIRKVGEGDKSWAKRMADRSRKCGFIPTVKVTGYIGYSPKYSEKKYGVYIKQDKKAKVHDYRTLLIEPWKIK